MSMKNSERSARLDVNIRPWVREALAELAEKMTTPEDQSKQMSMSRLASDLLEDKLREMGARR